jgi:hypothetical protein
MIGRMLGVTAASQVRGSVRPALVTALLLAGAAYASERLTVTSWIALVGASSVTLAVFATLAFALGLPVRLRRSLIVRLRRVAQLT